MRMDSIRLINNCLSWLILSAVVLLISNSAYASETIVINEKNINSIIYWKGKQTDIFLDRDNAYNFNEISAPGFQKNFLPSNADVPIGKEFDKSYWLRIKVRKDTRDNLQWVFEAYDQSIDEVDIYIPNEKDEYKKYSSGDSKDFFNRSYEHKNFVFDVIFPPGKTQTIYLRLKASHRYGIIGVIRHNHQFIGYALSEYFYLALFYGLVLCMIIYNLMQFLTTKTKNYIVYVFYIVAAGIYASTNDGLGFQFLWSHLPFLNNILQAIASYILIILAFIFSYIFLRDAGIPKLIYKIALGLMAVRTLILLIDLFNLPFFISSVAIDFISRSLILYTAIYCWQHGYKPSRYFSLGFLMLLIGYTIHELTINSLFYNSIITVYFHLIGESFQMLFLTLAMGDRMRIFMKEMNDKQQATLIQLEETNRKTEIIRQDLETKVNEQMKTERFLSTGVTKLGDILTNNLSNKQELFNKIISFTAQYFECRLAALYIIPFKSKDLQLAAGYGLDSIHLQQTSISPGEGILGQVLIDKEKKIIKDIPEDYIQIGSGLGSSSPKIIYIEPLVFNNSLIGVIEIASFREFNDLEYQLLQKFAEQMSSTISNVTANEVTIRMLDESKETEEQLKMQEEEMRQQLEEMQSTQEDYHKKEQLYLKEIEALKEENKKK